QALLRRLGDLGHRHDHLLWHGDLTGHRARLGTAAVLLIGVAHGGPPSFVGGLWGWPPPPPPPAPRGGAPPPRSRTRRAPPPRRSATRRPRAHRDPLLRAAGGRAGCGGGPPPSPAHAAPRPVPVAKVHPADGAGHPPRA